MFCFLVSSRMPKILVASVHSGFHERRMEGVLYSKTVLDNKKRPRKEVFCQKCRPVVMVLLTDYTRKYFFLIKNVTIRV